MMLGILEREGEGHEGEGVWKTVTGMGHTQGKTESSKRGEVEQSAGLSFCIRTQVSHRVEEKELKGTGNTGRGETERLS